MISKKLNLLLLLSIPIYFFHGMEEYFNGFYQTDSVSRFFFQPFQSMNSLQATFLLFQIMILVILIISFLLLQGKKYVLYMVTIFGLFFIFEFHHLYKAITQTEYYPGLITALIIYILGFFYWKELIKNWRKT